MLTVRGRQPLRLSLMDQVACGEIPRVPERDLACKKCVDSGLEGKIFESSDGLFCAIHGAVGSKENPAINRSVVESKFRLRYERDLIMSVVGDQKELVVTSPASVSIQDSKDEMLALAEDMFLADKAGISQLKVYSPNGSLDVDQTRVRRRAAALALAWMYKDFGCDARRKECGIFPVFDPKDKGIGDDPKKRTAIGHVVWTGYPFHHRIAEDFGILNTGQIDFSFGEHRVLSEKEIEENGFSIKERVCPDCEGTGNWKKKQGRECYKCNSTGVIPPDRVIGVEASLYVHSVAKNAREIGIPYVPIKRNGFVSLDIDAPWRGGSLLDKAKKRAEVACLRAYAPMRARHDNTTIIYAENSGSGVFDPEAGLLAESIPGDPDAIEAEVEVVIEGVHEELAGEEIISSERVVEPSDGEVTNVGQ